MELDKFFLKHFDDGKSSRKTRLIGLLFPILLFIVQILVVVNFGNQGGVVMLFILTAFTLYIIAIFKPKMKVFFRSLSYLVLIHFLIFPFIYVFTLNSDASNFKIDKEVELNEIENARKEAEEEFQISNSLVGQKAIQQILDSKSPYLDKKLPDNYYNLYAIKIDTFILYSNYVNPEIGRQPKTGNLIIIGSANTGETISILQRKLNNKTEFYSDYEDTKDFLLQALQHLNNLHREYGKRIVDINNKQYWTYLTILPHSILIFNLDNVVPKKNIANYIYLIHMILVPLILMGIIVQEFLERFRRSNQRNENTSNGI